jgi:hypothetical protein
MSVNTGYKAFANLEEYYLDNGIATGNTKVNDISDPDYVAPVYDPTFCPLPSPTPSPTPTISTTPSITPTVTPSVTTTPTITPSISITPSITPSVTITPSITPSVTITRSVTPTRTPTPSITPTITPSPSTYGTAPLVINVQGYTQPCIGGSCDDYLGWFIVLNSNVLVDTNYSVNIDLYFNGVYSFTYTGYGTIPAGASVHNSDPCSGGGTYIGCNYTVNSTCVASIDSPINASIYAC